MFRFLTILEWLLKEIFKYNYQAFLINMAPQNDDLTNRIRHLLDTIQGNMYNPRTQTCSFNIRNLPEAKRVLYYFFSC